MAMNPLTLSGPETNPEQPKTNLRQFAARRGILLMKETKKLGTITAEHPDKIVVNAVIQSIANITKGETTYGIQFQHEARMETKATSYIDLDETDELISALEFIQTLANRLINEERDYTEVMYITKENINVGFYQSNGVQQGFIKLDRYSILFISLENLQLLRTIIETAKNHLISKGAQT